MTARQFTPLHVYLPPDDKWAVVRGPARDLLAESGVHGRWSNAARGYEVASDRIPDFLALADARGFHVRIHAKAAS